MANHDPIVSPSSLQYVALCPRRGQLCAGVKQSTSVAMEDGTEQHEIMAGTISAALNGKSLANNIPEKFRPAIECAVSHTNAIAGMYDADAAFLVEYSLDLKRSVDIEHGTLDLAIIDGPGTRAALVDYKFGISFVDAPAYNWQMKCYAVGLLEKYPTLKTIAAYIVQPNVDEQWQLKTAIYTADEIEEYREQIRAIVKAARSPDAAIIPGEKQCKFCRAKLVCPARQEQSLVPIGTFDVDNYIANITPKDRATIYERAKMVANYCKSIMGAVEIAAITKGIEVDGYELQPGRSSNNFKPEAAEVLEQLAAENGKPIDAVYELISPSNAYKIFGKTKKTKELLEPVIVTTKGELKLGKKKG